MRKQRFLKIKIFNFRAKAFSWLFQKRKFKIIPNPDVCRRFQSFPEKMKKHGIFQTFPEYYKTLWNSLELRTASRNKQYMKWNKGNYIRSCTRLYNWLNVLLSLLFFVSFLQYQGFALVFWIFFFCLIIM